MKQKEEELLAINYKLEKATIKLENFDKQISMITNKLKKAEGHRLFLTVGFILLLISIGAYYFIFTTQSSRSNANDELLILQKQNDSLQEELEKLKYLISENEQKYLLPNDTVKNTDTLIVTERSGLVIDSLEDQIRYEQRYAYIKNVKRRNNVNFIEVDFIEYYEGKKAVLKATELKEAEYEIDKNGDTLFFLYKNYYIHNPELNTVILELAENVQVNMINQSANGFSIKAFQEVIKDNPVMSLILNNGIVYTIKKQNMP